jgi:hypothetical protein
MPNLRATLKFVKDTPEEQAPERLLSDPHFSGKRVIGPTKHTQPLGFAAGLHLYVLYFSA